MVVRPIPANTKVASVIMLQSAADCNDEQGDIAECQEILRSSETERVDAILMHLGCDCWKAIKSH
ncbi:MAG: hypothetical protein KDA80_08255, partial [Planctomycetaceae bacterium]|nr:hypothetical protein [Planctomycetaceae bacterium]